MRILAPSPLLWKRSGSKGKRTGMPPRENQTTLPLAQNPQTLSLSRGRPKIENPKTLGKEQNRKTEHGKFRVSYPVRNWEMSRLSGCSIISFFFFVFRVFRQQRAKSNRRPTSKTERTFFTKPGPSRSRGRYASSCGRAPWAGTARAPTRPSPGGARGTEPGTAWSRPAAASAPK